MAMTMAEQQSHLEQLMTAYDALVKEAEPENPISPEEQTLLDRIGTKLEQIKAHLGAAEDQTGNADRPDGAAAGKAGRIGKLKDMQSAIAGLMSALKTAR